MRRVEGLVVGGEKGGGGEGILVDEWVEEGEGEGQRNWVIGVWERSRDGL